ncbi:MAG: M23 family metallopeptidase, partial [Bacteroidia bacterium]
TMLIQHPNDFISVYKHNAVLLKKEGTFVHAGDAVALVGNTGELSSGPHLHFELWKKGVTVNPLDFINF